MVKRMEEQEKKDDKTDENNIQKKIEKHQKKWKMKFIRIWQYNDQLQREQANLSQEMELSVGPSNFVPIMKLG